MPSKNKVIFAAAGAGKTYGICKQTMSNLNTSSKKILLVTYTNKGVESLANEYRKQNFGVIDERVDIKTWYQFLLSEMIKPYQNFILGQGNIVRSIDFTSMYGKPNFKKRGTKEHYLNRHNDVLVNAASELAVDCNTASEGKVVERLSKVYSHIYIDEIQDFVGVDLDLLNLIFGSSTHVTCVGDYKQATFRTHNAKKNKKTTGTNIIEHFNNLEKQSQVAITFHTKSRRFNQDICNFSNSIFPDGNEIETIMSETSDGDGVYLITACEMSKYISHYNPVVLKYDSKTTTFGYDSYNFGVCKGMTLERVLIFPNKPFLSFIKDGKSLSSPSKYYVASTRARYSMAFVVDKLFETDCFKFSEIEINGEKIKVSKYTKL